jgi:hypothetical protein
MFIKWSFEKTDLNLKPDLIQPPFSPFFYPSTFPTILGIFLFEIIRQIISITFDQWAKSVH